MPVEDARELSRSLLTRGPPHRRAHSRGIARRAVEIRHALGDHGKTARSGERGLDDALAAEFPIDGADRTTLAAPTSRDIGS